MAATSKPAAPAAAPAAPPVDLTPLRAVLGDLMAARALLDAAMKDG